MIAGCDFFLPKPVDLELLEQPISFIWVYGDSELDTLYGTLPSPQIASKHEPEILLDDLTLPPALVQMSLLQAARVGDIAAVLDLVDNLEATDIKYKPFVTQAHHFCRTYQVQKLCDWLEGMGG